MTIRALRPAKIANKKITLPQCAAAVDVPIRSKMWAKKNYDPKRCQKEAGIAIGATCYCRQHAANIALNRWLTGGLIENPAKEAKDGSSQSEEDSQDSWSPGHS